MAKASKKATTGSTRKKGPALTKASLVALPTALSRPSTIGITFFGGLGQATVALFRQGNMINMQTTSLSANIHFSDVQSGDVIAVNGVATGKATISIDLATSPETPTNFGSGPFNIIYGVL